MSVIFLAGVHGVGKGFLGAPVAKSLGIRHFTASELIREEKGLATWRTDKCVADINDNQAALIRSVNRKRDERSDILLDGHFVLYGASGELVLLGKSVFSDLQLLGVVLLTEETQIIVDRIACRDGSAVNPEAIAKLSAEESANAEEVCSALQIPLSILHSPTVQTLTEVVVALLKK